MRLLLVTTLLAVACPIRADEPLKKSQLAKLAKSATALVEHKKRVMGTAFCIAESGLFVTNHHLLEAVGDTPDVRVQLVLNSGEKEERILNAKPVRSDKALDLALLQVEPAPEMKLSTLTVGKDDGV